MCDFLKDCDAMGVPVSLNLNKEGVKRTHVGGLFSLIAILITMVLVIEEMYKIS